MTETRPAAVAGSFYPQDSRELRRLVNTLLQHADAERPPFAFPRTEIQNAIIVPHAGYIYSGPIAASAYRYFQKSPVYIKTVVVLGPAHRVLLRGCASPTAIWFETPLGKIPIAQELIEYLLKQKLIHNDDIAHANEHSIEVHLPFLQTIFEDFSLLPLLVGDVNPDTVAKIISHVWGPNTLIVISTDLSHFLDYDSAQRRDRETSKAIESLNYNAIGPEDACGCVALSGILLQAQKTGLSVKTLDCRNSADTAGDKQRVVGYGAYMVYENAT